MAENDPFKMPENIALWAKYEDIAMHFNDLIMRWRLQAMGGLGALITIGGFVVKDPLNPTLRYRGMLILSATLAFAWVAVALIDLFYYQKLLKGAVTALLDLEKRKEFEDVQLSSVIELHARTGSRMVPWLFYAMGLFPLVMIAGWAVFHLYVAWMINLFQWAVPAFAIVGFILYYINGEHYDSGATLRANLGRKRKDRARQ
jgi:hypothetical protein